MARKTLDIEKIIRIKELRKQGIEIKEIAKIEKVSIGVVHKYSRDIDLKAGKVTQTNLSNPLKNKVEKYKAQVEIERQKILLKKAKLEQAQLDGYYIFNEQEIFKLISIVVEMGRNDILLQIPLPAQDSYHYLEIQKAREQLKSQEEYFNQICQTLEKVKIHREAITI